MRFMKKDIIHNAKFWKPNIKEDILLYKGHFNTFEFDKHVHEEYTITLVQKGKMKTFLDGSSNDLGKSSILTLNPDEVHACKANNDLGYKYNTIYFKPSLLENIFKEYSTSKDIYFKETTLNNKNLYQRLSFLVAQDEKNQISKLDFECEFLDILRNILNLNSTINVKTNINAHDTMIIKAKEYMNDNFSWELSLDDIAKELNISKYHFLRLFKEKMHISPHTYLMLKRVEKAKQALQKGESLIQTAYHCGFNDQSHLNRRFKAITGLTPGYYKSFFN